MTPELEIFARHRHAETVTRPHHIVERLPARRRRLAAVADRRSDRRSWFLTPGGLSTSRAAASSVARS